MDRSILIPVIGSTLMLALVGAFNLWLISRHQRKLRFLHPGWVLVGVTVFYGLPVPLFWIVAPDVLYELSPSFLRHYNPDVFLFIILLFVTSLAGFWFGEFFIWSTAVVRRRARGNIWHSAKVMLRKAALMRILITLGVLVGGFLFWSYYRPVGGFISFISYDLRRDAFHDLTQMSAGALHYGRIFQSVFVFFGLHILTQGKHRSLYDYILSVILCSYIFLSLLRGTRLEIITLSLGTMFLVYALRPEMLRRWRMWIILVGVALALVLTVYGDVRNEFRTWLFKGEKVQIALGLASLFPSESITGYVPGLISIGNEFEPFHTPYWLRAIPSTLAGLLQIKKPETLSQSIANYLRGPGGRAVYTITLPTDSYLGTGTLAGTFAISVLLYVGFYILISVASRMSLLGIGLGALIYMNLWYVVRVEVANWFPRVWQSVLIYILFLMAAALLGLRPSAVSSRKGWQSASTNGRRRLMNTINSSAPYIE